jgi:ribonuclease-3
MSEERADPCDDLLQAVRDRLGVTFSDAVTVRRALCHRSAVPQDPGASYERLEFLGDSVISLVVCEWLYRSFPELPEGELAKRRGYLVSGPVLSEAGRLAGVDELVAVGATAAESDDRQRASIRADVIEAIVGAAYVDRGLRTARALVRRLLRPALKHASGCGFESDHKTRLQELTQARWRTLPIYAIGQPSGEPHRPTFTATVSLGDRVLGSGQGASKRLAQQAAAREALTRLTLDGDACEQQAP